jgi:hypothetical protein
VSDTAIQPSTHLTLLTRFRLSSDSIESVPCLQKRYGLIWLVANLFTSFVQTGEPTNIKVMDVINLNSSSLSPLAIAIKRELDAGVPLVSTRSSKDDNDADEVAFHCTLESIAGGNAIACHDPSGCSDSDDETEWCSISPLAKTGDGSYASKVGVITVWRAS